MGHFADAIENCEAMLLHVRVGHGSTEFFTKISQRLTTREAHYLIILKCLTCYMKLQVVMQIAIHMNIGTL